MGRNPVAAKDKKKQRQVYLTDGENKDILKGYDTLTDAIKAAPLKKNKTAAIQTAIPKRKK